MHDRELRLIEILRSCDYDTGSLSPADYSGVWQSPLPDLGLLAYGPLETPVAGREQFAL